MSLPKREPIKRFDSKRGEYLITTIHFKYFAKYIDFPHFNIMSYIMSCIQFQPITLQYMEQFKLGVPEFIDA